MKNKLTDHYDNKYQNDTQKKSLAIINKTKYPQNRYEACINYFDKNVKKKTTVLELATGDGLLAKSLLKNQKNITKYIATDLSNNRLKSVKNNIHDSRLVVRNLDVENYDFSQTEKVDVVIMLALIEHLVDPIRAINNIKKVLKPNGLIYIDTPNVAELGNRIKLLRGKFPSTASAFQGLITYEGEKVDLFDEGHLHYFTFKSLEQMLLKYCGFENVSKHYQMIGRRFLGKPIQNLLAKLWPQAFSSVVLIAQK